MRVHRYVYSYDIPSHHRRRKLAQCLLNYAVRVQFSVFEAVLTVKQHHKLVGECMAWLDIKEDSFKVFCLPEPPEDKMAHFGIQKLYEGEKGLIL